MVWSFILQLMGLDDNESLPNHTHNIHPCRHEVVHYSKQWDHLIIPLFLKPIASSGSSSTPLKLFCNQLQATKRG